ncbi:MAG: hypothetical protein U0228_08335 [Myxococcaceae bacterium]
MGEYRRFLGRHAQSLVVEPQSSVESPAALATWLTSARAVLSDESNIFDPQGDLVRADYVGPARNICRLHAWVLDAKGEVVRRSYIREVAGHFDGTKLRPDDPTVFAWDAAFTSAAGTTLEAMSAIGLKNSAREQCLSAFVKERLWLEQRKALKWTPVDPTDWSTDARLLLEHPLYAHLREARHPLWNALSHVVREGVFFRSARSRREGNYWFPGLNGGLPYVPKSDPVHEATYLFHDVMHQLMPDLLFDGTDSVDHRRTYIAWRMLSEAISLSLADMWFVDTLAPRAEHQGYDFARRRIYPLFRALPAEQRADPKWLVQQVCRFVLLGQGGELARCGPAWDAFSEKYSRFFVADFQWTRMNWQNLQGRAAMARQWVTLVRPETFRAQRLSFVAEVVERIGRDLPLSTLVERLFELVWAERIAPALAPSTAPLDVERSTAAGFRRWLLGQLAFFARYQPLLGLPPLAHQLAARVRDERPLGQDERVAIRGQLKAHLEQLAKQGVLSDDDARLFPECFPLFDPFFLRDYDEAQQEFATVAEASARAFA